MRPFPDGLSDPLAPDAALQAAFDTAIAATPLPGVPFTIVALNDPGAGPHPMAGQRGSEMHYSASVLKLQMMFAAFALRQAANAFLLETAPAAGDVFAALRAEFNQTILDNLVPQLARTDPRFLLPTYERIFDVLTAPVVGVNFSAGFFGHLHDAISLSKNEGAGACVQALGFGYLTGAASQTGLFDADAASGLWLCGDFSQGWPKVTVDTVNDHGVAQAMTTDMMARLVTHMFDRQLVDELASNAMQGLMAASVPAGHFFVSRVPGRRFATLLTKIGVGPLKTGGSVASEASVLRDVGTGRHFVAVWQNHAFASDASLAPVARVIDQTIAIATS
jgi:hypothetical protein